MPQNRSQFCSPEQPSLEAILDQALREGRISASRIAATRAAVAAFARLTHQSPAELPAHQGFIIQQMRRLRCKPTGLAPKTLSNIRSALLFLVKVVGDHGPRSAFALTDDWEVVRATLRRGPDWWSLSRLAGFFSRKGVVPQAVRDADLERFVEALQRSGEVGDPVGHGRRVIRVWNKLAAQSPPLQIALLTLRPQERKRWTLSESAFPQSFRADVDAWFQRVTTEDPFSSRPSRALRPSTVHTRKHQLFKAASALVLAGWPIELVRSLADLVEFESFQRLLRYLHERQDCRCTEALHGLAGGLLAVARHHVRVDRKTEGRLARIVKNLDVDATGFRSKTRARLAAFEDDRHVSALLHLPAGLLGEARRQRTPRRRRQLAQMAIAIEILSFAPMRVGNLASLRLGATMRRLTLGRERRWLITIPADAVKNRTELTYELPKGSDPLIEATLALYDQPEGWLFPGRQFGPKATNLLSGQIKRVIESRVGVAFHTHMFRALAGYLHLRENPNGFEAVRALLGNRDDSVIRNNYAFLAERSLIKHAQSAISQTRARLVPPKDKRRDV